ncbi:MAG TPA: hypothetical protein VMZ53_14860 [Kofleriaceae bacterium]|nr:hypothetical protein [Kofleriaceae bacterium]
MRGLVAVALLAGCGGASASGSASISIHDDLAVAPTALQACASGDINAQMQIVADLRDSYHEMIVCGGLSMQFNNSITSVIANALLQKAMGTPLQYQGNGVYATPNGVMWIRVSTDAGPLSFNALDPQSYLAGLTVTVNAQGMVGGAMQGGGGWGSMLGRAAGKADVQVSFQGEGPGFNLLGITPQEARSGRLDQYLKRIEHSLGSLIRVENRVTVNNQHGGTTIQYLLQSPPTPIVDMSKKNAVPMQLVSITATNQLGQQVSITKWTMDYKGDGGKVLDGTIGMDIAGGTFPYHVEMTYPHRAEPDITLSCGNAGAVAPIQ